MATSSTYVAVRDDKSLRSLSVNERVFLRTGAHATNFLRIDGRRVNETRKVRLKLGRWDNGAECTVQWGVGTRVTALCSAEIVPPSPDRPNEGMVNFTVDLSPMAGTNFLQAPSVGTALGGSFSSIQKGGNFSDKNQRLLSNRILRSIERIVLLGGALDSEALVLIPGSWVWRITIALTVLDDGGNILDACVLAAMATLRHYRKPQADIGDTMEQDNSEVLPTLIPSTLKEPSPLPLHHTPLAISFALLPSQDTLVSESSVAILVDPEKREELVQFGSLTVAMNTHSEVCLLDYGGGHELSPTKLKDCLSTASVVVKHLCEELERSLDQADTVAQREMLNLLQLKRNGEPPETEKPEKDVIPTTPYIQMAGQQGEIMDIEEAAIDQATTEAEENYRQQALDYSIGHVATTVREDDDRLPKRKDQSSSNLFTSLLKAAGDE